MRGIVADPASAPRRGHGFCAARTVSRPTPFSGGWRRHLSMSYLAGVRRVGVGLVVCLVVALLLAGAAGAGTRRAPRFSLSTSSAIAGDDVVVRLVRPPNVQGRVLRIYLVRRTDASSVHSCFAA